MYRLGLYWTSQIGQEGHSSHRIRQFKQWPKNKHWCNSVLNESRGNVKTKAGQPSPKFLSQLCGKAVADLQGTDYHSRGDLKRTE